MCVCVCVCVRACVRSQGLAFVRITLTEVIVWRNVEVATGTKEKRERDGGTQVARDDVRGRSPPCV